MGFWVRSELWLRWAPATLAEQPQNIILMGWDGCHRDHVEALLKEDNLPNTKNLIAEGTGSHVEGSGIMNHTTPIRTALLLLASCTLCAGESQVQLRAMGDGIFATRPWLVYGELEPEQEAGEFELDKKGIVFDDPATVRKGRLKLHEGDIRFTRSKDGKIIYAARLSWPEKPFTLTSFFANGVGKEVNVASISLLGSDERIKWEKTAKGVVITPPRNGVFDDASWPVIFKIKTDQEEIMTSET